MLSGIYFFGRDDYFLSKVLNVCLKLYFAINCNLKMAKMNLNEIFQSVRAASRKLAMWDVETVNALLCAVADRIEEKTDSLLEVNREDLLRMEVSNPKYDRLKLTKERLSGIAADMRQVAALPSPLGRVLESYTVPSGLRLKR